MKEEKRLVTTEQFVAEVGSSEIDGTYFPVLRIVAQVNNKAGAQAWADGMGRAGAKYRRVTVDTDELAPVVERRLARSRSGLLESPAVGTVAKSAVEAAAAE